MVRVYTYGKMEESTMGNGLTTIWRALAFIFGLMAEGTKDNIMMIKSQAMEFTCGLMEDDMKDGGARESNMVLVTILILTSKK